jgi:nucleoside-diphosphate-sugar epimerase
MELKGKKILVTGGAGFIGSHLCERLIKEGSEVIVLDNFSTGRIENLEDIKEKITLINGDVRDYDLVLETTKGVNIIIHEAFPYGKSGMGIEEQYIEEGILGTFNLLKAAVKNNVKKFVNVSSVSVYGIQKEALVKEDFPINVFLPYGVTKYSAELYCKAFSKLYGLDTVSLRYFYVYGPRYARFDHSALVNFLNRTIKDQDLIIYGDGNQIRDYTYISDVIKGTILAAKKDNNNGEVYNISYGEGKNILEIAKKIIEISKKQIKIKFSEFKDNRFSDKYCKIPIGLTTRKEDKWIDERSYIGDISKAKKLLGYSPKINIEEGVKLTLNWMESIEND